MILELEINTGLFDMKQTGLVQRVIEAVGLDDGTVKGKFTPSYHRPLVNYSDGELTSGVFRYSNVVGMLLYLSGLTRPDIAFTVNLYAQ